MARVGVWPESVCGQSRFVAKIGLWPKTVCGQKRFVAKNGLWPKTVCGQKQFVAKNGFWPKSVWTPRHNVSIRIVKDVPSFSNEHNMQLMSKTWPDVVRSPSTVSFTCVLAHKTNNLILQR